MPPVTRRQSFEREQQEENPVKKNVGLGGVKRRAFGDVSNKLQQVIGGKGKKGEQAAVDVKKGRVTRSVVAALKEAKDKAAAAAAGTKDKADRKRKSSSDEKDDVLTKKAKKDTTSQVKRRRSARLIHNGPRRRSARLTPDYSLPPTDLPDDNDYLVPPRYRISRSDFGDGTSQIRGLANHDRANENDELQVSHYVTDIIQHCYALEQVTRPQLYMHNHSDINARMRSILVDWLVEVHSKFRLVPSTLHLAINVLDRYCEKESVVRSKLQLVGVTALLIACKYEEIYPPEVRDCVYITDNAYDRDEVLAMEKKILDRLKFNISAPTGYPFLERFLMLTKASKIVRHAAQYYVERMLQEHDMLEFPPSLLAGTAVIMALNNPYVIVKEMDLQPGLSARRAPGFPPLLMEYAGFDKHEIIRCAEMICDKVSQEPVTASNRQLIACKRKFKDEKFAEIGEDCNNPNINQLTRHV